MHFRYRTGIFRELRRTETKQQTYDGNVEIEWATLDDFSHTIQLSHLQVYHRFTYYLSGLLFAHCLFFSILLNVFLMKSSIKTRLTVATHLEKYYTILGSIRTIHLKVGTFRKNDPSAFFLKRLSSLFTDLI